MRWLLLLLLLPAVAGHPEAAAPHLRDDVVAVGHAPDPVAAGQQWTGFIQLAPGHDIVAVQYQVCRVGQACFAPPTAAEQDTGSPDTFRFDTSRYLAGGRPIAWGVGDGAPWLIGYKFLLKETSGNVTAYPPGLAPASAQCQELGWSDCDATNYFVFTIQGEAAKQAPMPAALLIVALALAARRL